MVDELLVPPQIQDVRLFCSHDEAEPVDPEMATGPKVGHSQLGICASNDIGRGAGGARYLGTDHRAQRIDSVTSYGSTHR